MKNTNQIINSTPKARTTFDVRTFDGRVVSLIVNEEVELFSGNGVLRQLDANNHFVTTFKEAELDINEAELEFLNKIVEEISGLEKLFDYDHSAVDSRDIIEKLEAIDSVIEEAKGYNEEYIGDFSDYDSIEDYTNLILLKGVSASFISLIEHSYTAMKNNTLNLNELEYIEDWKYGVPLYLKRDFDVVDYLSDLGYFDNLQHWIKQHIDENGLREEITKSEYRILGLDYIVV